MCNCDFDVCADALMQLRREVQKADYLLQEVDEGFMTRLSAAVKTNHLESVRYLVSFNADRTLAKIETVGNLLQGMIRIIDRMLLEDIDDDPGMARFDGRDQRGADVDKQIIGQAGGEAGQLRSI